MSGNLERASDNDARSSFAEDHEVQLLKLDKSMKLSDIRKLNPYKDDESHTALMLSEHLREQLLTVNRRNLLLASILEIVSYVAAVLLAGAAFIESLAVLYVVSIAALVLGLSLRFTVPALRIWRKNSKKFRTARRIAVLGEASRSRYGLTLNEKNKSEMFRDGRTEAKNIDGVEYVITASINPATSSDYAAVIFNKDY